MQCTSANNSMITVIVQLCKHAHVHVHASLGVGHTHDGWIGE